MTGSALMRGHLSSKQREAEGPDIKANLAVFLLNAQEHDTAEISNQPHLRIHGTTALALGEGHHVIE
jgi:hypothetical protein